MASCSCSLVHDGAFERHCTNDSAAPPHHRSQKKKEEEQDGAGGAKGGGAKGKKEKARRRKVKKKNKRKQKGSKQKPINHRNRNRNEIKSWPARKLRMEHHIDDDDDDGTTSRMRLSTYLPRRRLSFSDMVNRRLNKTLLKKTKIRCLPDRTEGEAVSHGCVPSNIRACQQESQIQSFVSMYSNNNNNNNNINNKESRSSR